MYPRETTARLCWYPGFSEAEQCIFNQRLGIFTGNEIDPADVFLLAQQHFLPF